MQRRELIKYVSGLAALSMGLNVASKPALSAESLIHDLPRTTEALFELTRGAAILPSTQIELLAAPWVEYAPRWPLRLVQRIAGASWMALVVEQNAQPLAAVFRFRSIPLHEIATSIKIADSSQVTAVVAAAGRFYGARYFIKLVSNCG